MTNTELEKSRIANISPFAHGDDETSVLPYEDAESIVDIKNGFKQSTHPVEKADMNGAFQIATRNQSFENRGGFYTFDSSFCTAIGGYPKGCVLYYYNGSSVFFVESLVNNNTHDYYTDGIDNVHWRLAHSGKYLDYTQSKDIDWDARKLLVLYSFGQTSDLQSNTSERQYIHSLTSGTFKSKGYIVVDTNSFVFASNHVYPFRIVLCVSAIGAESIKDINPADIIANPVASSVHAFPVTLMSGWSGNNFAFVTNQIQVQKDSNYSLWIYTDLTINSSGHNIRNFIYSGAINIYFLPTPD